jgi:3-oxoacyl-[acyl-carrier protein] reductase
MKIDLLGKKAMVCGSTQGIGKAIAIALAEAGAGIVLVARNEDKLKEVVRELSVRHGQNHSWMVADFSKPETLKNALLNYINSKTTIDILVNNTGGPAPASVVDSDPQDFANAFSMHLLCNQMLAQAVVPGMKSQNFGRIINIISTSVKEPIAGLGVSNTVRLAVASWAKTLAGELGPFGITVNNILPGYIKTSRLTSLIEKKMSAKGKSREEIEIEMLQEIPVNRFGEPSELADLAVFLSNSNASYINGVSIPLDGGKTKAL